MKAIIDTEFAEIDFTSYPLIFLNLNALDPSIQQVDDFADAYEELITSRKGHFVSVVDASKLSWISGSSRVQLGKRSKIIEQKFDGRELTSFMVIPNILIKSILQGFNLVAKPQVPQVVCKTRDEAIKLAQEKLKSVKPKL